MALRFKGDVVLEELTDELVHGFRCAIAAFDSFGADAIVTSVDDGMEQHGRGGRRTLHGQGLAFDCRSKHLHDLAEKHDVAEEMRARLGDGWQTLLEFVGQPHEHFHSEYDPKE